jgi:plastocyanin
VAAGQTVTFVNNDNRPHEIASNPHPAHGSCPSIEGGLGSLAPGQTRTTRAFANSGSCGFHDHLDDSNPALRGTINVQ